MRASASRQCSRTRRSASPPSRPTSCGSSSSTRAFPISPRSSERCPPTRNSIGLRVDEVFPDFERTLKQVAETGETRFDEAWEIASEPAPRYVNRIISAVRGRFSGITQSLTVLIQDVTEQVKAKREIEDLAQMMAERSARLDSILSSMTDGLWVYDAKGEVVDVNQAALAMFGLGSRTEAVENGTFDRSSSGIPMAARFRLTICRSRARCAGASFPTTSQSAGI